MGYRVKCPKCKRYLAAPLSACKDGRCPFCGYKPGEDELREKEKKRLEKQEARSEVGSKVSDMPLTREQQIWYEQHRRS